MIIDMKKQTAVDLLIDKIRSHISENGKLDAITISRFKMHAKAIEKQQIIDAYRDGRSDQLSKESIFYNRTSEQYYNGK
jgi:hypothetical protein